MRRIQKPWVKTQTKAKGPSIIQKKDLRTKSKSYSPILRFLLFLLARR
jgi:hypothetical protein